MVSISPENILRHELIGLEVKITNSSNNRIVGLKGKVIDETRNTLIITNEKNRKMIPKDVSVFQFKLPDGTAVKIDGVKLVGRPENRLKNRVRKW
ncbi:MAG: ribonuclease P protein component 1 [Candidatus Aminicenantes bacterium]|nr:MAG: ribonuclease P protein component 1 [Candidatus Aminicenantes bacterium]